MLLVLSRARICAMAWLAMLAAVGCGKSESPPPPKPVDNGNLVGPGSQPASSVDEPLVAQPGTTLYQLDVEGMHCQGCADTIAKKLGGLPGVRQARVSFSRKTAWVTVEDRSPTASAQIEQAVAATGYKAKPASAPALAVGLSQSEQIIIAEANSPAVGADGKLAQSLGIETLGGVFTPLLNKGSEVPCSTSEVFSTAADNQSQIRIQLYRGNAARVADCHRIGSFQVVGVAPAPRGTPQIRVTLAVREGRVLLSAVEATHQRPMAITVVTESPP